MEEKKTVSSSSSTDEITIPLCCERIIETLKRHYDGTQRLASAADIDAQYSLLQQQKELEELVFDLPSLASLHAAPDKNNVATLVECMRLIRPLDVDLTITLAKKNAAASKCVEGQTIILLLGPTGAGKSTTIQFLAGLQMEETKVNRLKHTQCTAQSLKDRNDPVLADIVSSPNLKSETNCVRAVEVKFREHLNMDRDGSIFLCDTPGFGDTAGDSVELSNGLGLVRAVQKAKEVRPLILISKGGVGERFENLLKFVITLTSLIKNMDTNVDSLSYLFTKYYAEEAEELNERLRQKKDNLSEEEKCSESLLALLSDIIKKTDESAPTIRPVKDKPAALMKSLLTAAPIKNPQEHFVTFVTPSSMGVLSTQLNELELSISRALIRKNFPLLEYRFEQLHALWVYLDLEQCRSKFDACQANLLKYLRTDFEAITGALRNLFLPGNFADLSVGLDECLQDLSKFMKFENLRSRYLAQEFGNLSEECVRPLSIHQKSMFQLISNSVAANPTDGPTWLEQVPYQQLHKMELLAQRCIPVFGEIVSLSEQASQARVCLTLKFEEVLNNSQIAIQDRNFAGFGTSMRDATLAWDAGAKAICSQAKFDAAKAYAIQHFAPKVDSFVEELQQDQVRDAKAIVALIIDLRAVKAESAFPELTDGLSAILSKLSTACITYIETRGPYVAERLLVIDSQSFSDIQRVWGVMHVLLQPYEVSDHASKFFQDTTDKIRTVLQATREKLEISAREQLGPEFASGLKMLQLAQTHLSSELLGPLVDPMVAFLRRVQEIAEEIQAEVSRAVFERPEDPASCLSKYLKYVELNALDAEIFPVVKQTVDTTAKTLCKLLTAALSTSSTQLEEVSFEDSQAGTLFQFCQQLSRLCASLDLPELHEQAKLLGQRTTAIVEFHIREAKEVFESSCDFVFSRVEQRAPQNAQPGRIPMDLSKLDQYGVGVQRFAGGLIIRGSQVEIDACIAALSPKLNVTGPQIKRVKPNAPNCELLFLSTDQANDLALEFSSISQAEAAALIRLEKLALMSNLEKKPQDDATQVSALQQVCNDFISSSLARLRKAANPEDTKDLEALQVKLDIAQNLKRYDSLAASFELTALNFGEGETNLRLLLKEFNLGFENNLRIALQTLNYDDVKSCAGEAKIHGEGTIATFTKELTAKLHSEIARLVHEVSAIDVQGAMAVEMLASDLNQIKNCQNLVSFVGSKDLEQKSAHALTQLGPCFVKLLEVVRNCISRHDFEKFEHVLGILKLLNPAHLQECGISPSDLERLRMDMTTSLEFASCYCSPVAFVTTENLVTRDSNLGVTDGAFVLSVIYDEKNPARATEDDDVVAAAPPPVPKVSAPETKSPTTTDPDDTNSVLAGAQNFAKNLMSKFGGGKKDPGDKKVLQAQASQRKLLAGFFAEKPAPTPTGTKPPPPPRGATSHGRAPSGVAPPPPPSSKPPPPRVPVTIALNYVKASVRLCVPLRPGSIDAVVSQFSTSKPTHYDLSADECSRLQKMTGYSPSQMNFESLRHRPPLVLAERLTKVGRDIPAYRAVLEDLNKNVIAECIAFMRSAPADSNPDQATDMLNSIKDLEQYLPLDWRGQLAIETTRLQDAIRSTRDKLARDLREMGESSTIPQMMHLFVQHFNAGNEFYAEQYRMHIFSLVHQKLDIAKDQLEKQPVSQVLVPLVSLLLETKDIDMLLESPPFRYYCHRFRVQPLRPRRNELRKSIILKVKNTFEKFNEYFLTDTTHLIEGFNVFACWGAWSQLTTNWKEPIVLLLQMFIEDAGTCQGSFEQDLKTNPCECDRSVIDRIKFLHPVVMHAQKLSKDLATLYPVFDTHISQLRPYSYFQDAFLNVVEQMARDLKPTLDTAILRSPNASERDEFYAELSNKAVFLRSGVWKGHIAFDMTECDNIDEHLKVELQKLEAKALLIKYVPNVNSSGVFDTAVENYQKLHALYDNFRSIQAQFKSPVVHAAADTARDNISNAINDQLNVVGNSIELSTCKLDEQCDLLVGLKTFGSSCFSFTDRVKKRIDKILDEMSKRHGGSDAIMRIGQKLKTHTVAKMALPLISDHQAFAAMATFLRNQKTCSLGISEIAKTLTASDTPDEATLEKYHKIFDVQYWGLVDEGLKVSNSDALAKIVPQTREVAESAKKHANDPERLLSLLAHVFAYWTLHHSSGYRQALNSDSKNDETEAQQTGDSEQRHFLLQPHAAQVVAIMRLFGIDAPGCKITNHLIQVLTGEGKSVILAITAAALALLGYVVDCACYSEYLSLRDYDAFSFLFDAFGIQDAISYGTFNKLCEGLVNEQGDLREMVVNMIAGKSGSEEGRSAKKRPSGPRVLLIDEVDVFFSSSFYGNEYRPLANVKDDTFSQLLRYVWSQKASLSFNVIKASSQYKACCSKFPDWVDLINEALKDVIVSLSKFDGHAYEVIGGRVCYKEQDTMNYNVSYGYLTMFAHLKAEEDGLVGASIAAQSLALSVSCGSFSYAEIPKKYTYIVGVTGTLENLAESQQQILETEYHIQKKTFLPSVYGKNHLVALSEVEGSVQIVATEGQHVLKIIEAIKTMISKNRAIFVFFETREKLKTFYNNPAMMSFKGVAKIITEETSASEKTNLIHQAATVKNIVLMTREFGRGTDFVCYDEAMNVDGGVHVVQTFPSDDKSEETQIGGRTARQGNKGSFGLIIDEISLEKYGLSRADVADMHNKGTKYATFDTNRQKWFSNMLGSEYLSAVTAVRAKHDLSMTFVKTMVAGKVADAKAYLLVENVGPRLAAALVRTMVLMDATGSMYNTLKNAKSTVGVMFERCEDILKSLHLDTRFEVKLGFYRNYNVTSDLLLQVSDWEAHSEKLKTFMQPITVSGGICREAMEVGLQHANNLIDDGDEIAQVLVIGDIGANTPDEVTAGRNDHNGGEKYWKQTPFRTPTNSLKEIQKLKDREVPIHTFYVVESARAEFEEIANATGGEHGFLKIDSADGADRLTDVISKKILGAAGGDAAVAAYDAKYSKRGYT